MTTKGLVLGITLLAIVGFSGIYVPAAVDHGFAIPETIAVHNSNPWFLKDNGKTGAASSSPTTYPGYIPIQIWDAYQYSSNGVYNTSFGSGETIAIIDAYGSPTISSDVNTFDQQFGLPAINLQIVQPFGKVSRNSGWALETSLDVEWAHAMAPAAKIVLIETPSASNTYLINDAVNYLTF